MSLPEAFKRAEFVRLREAYDVLGDVLACGGKVEVVGRAAKLSRIPRDRWKDVSTRLRTCEDLVVGLVEGSGEKRSAAGKVEIVVSCLSRPSGFMDICLLVVEGRSDIRDALCVSTSEPDWLDRIRGLTAWDAVASVIACADGNNQRAPIGAVLALAGIGKGDMPILEVEMPAEIDESTHLVRGAEWMKAGLPRFGSAASEAIWYLLRFRSVHSRLVRERKQGLYTAIAIMAFEASGISAGEISTRMGISSSLVRRLSASTAEEKATSQDFSFIEEKIYAGLPVPTDVRHAASRIWRGSAVYARTMDWRLSVSRRARQRLAAGDDLIDVAEEFRIQRRDLVRILSVSLVAAEREKERFLAGLARPDSLRSMIS